MEPTKQQRMASYNISIVSQYLFSCECGHYYIGTAEKRRCSKCYATNHGIRLKK